MVMQFRILVSDKLTS